MSQPPDLPPPGVSTTDGNGSHQPLPANQRGAVGASPGRRKPRNGRRIQRGDDALQDLESYKVVGGSPPTPAGTGRMHRDVREGVLPKTRKPRRHVTTFQSADGDSYSIRTHDPKGRPIPGRNELCLFLALVEMQKGGSPTTVFDAFNLRISDSETGNPIFPIPQEVLDRLEGHSAAEDMGVEVASGFTLGD